MLKKIFAPGNDTLGISLGLLSLRLWLGVSMLWLHGHGKLMTFNSKSASFPDPLGVGHPTSMALAIFAEFFASTMLAMGLLTRFAALVLSINFSVAFLLIHKHVLKGEGNGELPFVYLAGFVTLFLAGGGRFSTDKFLFGKGAKAAKPKAAPAA